MKITKFKHECNEKGVCKGGGAVVTEGAIRISRGEGCGIKNCHCSDGCWISIILPRKRGIVEGVKVQFKDLTEMDRMGF